MGTALIEGQVSTQRLAVLHAVASLKASSGGTSRSVPALCEALGALNLNVSLVSQCAKWPASPDLFPDKRLVETYLTGAVNLPGLRLSYSPTFERQVSAICKQQRVDIVHGHGIWLHTNHLTAHVASGLNIPLVISPRGMLEKWAMAYRGWKKRIAWQLYQLADLRSARAFCATSVEEAKQLRKLGFRQPIAIIPNGVDVPPTLPLKRASAGQHTALFLSRIHPKKGLIDLVNAWGAIRPVGWQLVIAGSDEDDYAQVVKAAVSAAGLDEVVQFVGEVSGEAKERLWCQADLFILPSYSENFGIVIAEALAWGIPVITTRGTPWSVLVESKCGWWIHPGFDGLKTALMDAVSLSDVERQEMGARGRLLTQQKLDWMSIARDTAGFYEWLLGCGEKPKCVLED